MGEEGRGEARRSAICLITTGLSTFTAYQAPRYHTVLFLLLACDLR